MHCVSTTHCANLVPPSATQLEERYHPVANTTDDDQNNNCANNKRTNMFSRVLDGLTKTIQASLVSFMVTMRKVETSHAKTGVDEFLQLRDFPTGLLEKEGNERVLDKHHPKAKGFIIMPRPQVQCKFVHAAAAADCLVGVPYFIHHTYRSERTNNLGLTSRRIRLAQHRLQGDVGSTKFRSRRSNVGLTKRHG